MYSLYPKQYKPIYVLLIGICDMLIIMYFLMPVVMQLEHADLR
jgi:hypothetical protein